eukprot:6456950-Prymnesium_polylepis.1
MMHANACDNGAGRADAQCGAWGRGAWGPRCVGACVGRCKRLRPSGALTFEAAVCSKPKPFSTIPRPSATSAMSYAAVSAGVALYGSAATAEQYVEACAEKVFASDSRDDRKE